MPDPTSQDNFNNNNDDFLSSFTFASGDIGCECCDGCGPTDDADLESKLDELLSAMAAPCDLGCECDVCRLLLDAAIPNQINDKPNEEKSSSNHDEFLSSMTFASGSGDIGCECDECGTGDAVPPTIRNAVNEHLRKRKLEQPSVFEGSKRLYIRQNRELVKREGGFSIWKLDMPVDGGDPIVEYRNSHRILFVKQLDKASNVLSIGQGIIGSAAEENARKRVNWEEGSSYLLPCSKGLACGWVHKLPIDDTKCKSNDIAEGGSTVGSPSSDMKDAVIYALKASPISIKDPPSEDTPCWVKKSYELFHQCLSKKRTDDTSDGGNGAIESILLSDEESLTMNLIIELAQ